MWPPRKILLVMPNLSYGEWVEALLKGLGIDYELFCAEPLCRSRDAGLSEAHEGQHNKGELWEEAALKCTEGIVWPGYEDYSLPEDMIFEGSVVRPLGEFLHTIFQSMVLIPIEQSLVEEDQEPLLFQIMQKAGFEPSALWQDQEGRWSAIHGQGVYWVVPKWIEIDHKMIGEYGKASFWSNSSWMVRSNQVDFYLDYPSRFVGSIARTSLCNRESEVCESIAQALSQGVSWGDISEFLHEHSFAKIVDREILPEFEWDSLLNSHEDNYYLSEVN